MHAFSELVEQCTGLTLDALRIAHNAIAEGAETTAATRYVKNLQVIQLQKAFFAVGLFSVFDAQLQAALNCDQGFHEAKTILEHAGELALRERLHDRILAINVLKHGRGRSYETLLGKGDALPFRVKHPDKAFFDEGDVSEVSTLIEADDAFVLGCAEVVREVAQAIMKERPNLVL